MATGNCSRSSGETSEAIRPQHNGSGLHDGSGSAGTVVTAWGQEAGAAEEVTKCLLFVHGLQAAGRFSIGDARPPYQATVRLALMGSMVWKKETRPRKIQGCKVLKAWAGLGQ